MLLFDISEMLPNLNWYLFLVDEFSTAKTFKISLLIC